MTTASQASFQGRLFSEQLFPSQTEADLTFSAPSRCLIDMGNCFLVLPEGHDEKQYQRSIFRLQVESRIGMTFVDDSRLPKDDCVSLLQSKLDELPYCDIVGVNFPLFAQTELADGLHKYRPCVALFGEGDQEPLYIGVYMGAPSDNMNAQFGLLLKAPKDILPTTAPISMVDCTKVCSFPNQYNLPSSILHGQSTWRKFRVDPSKPDSNFANHLRSANPDNLRKEIVEKLIALAIANPILEYVDNTVQLDIGTMVEGHKIHEGEWCTFQKVYEGPPSLSQLPTFTAEPQAETPEKIGGQRPKKVTP